MKTKALSEQNRNFFSLVADATFTNPFSARRAEIDRRIAGMLSETDWRKVVPRAVDQIHRRLVQLDEGGPRQIHDFDAADRELMTYTYLFETFHRFAKDFDDHIIRQQQSGDDPAPIPFAEKAIESLARRGFTPQQAGQIGRAHV